MPLKKTVAMERRIDLASLFCLIARHGPAVLVALLVIGCSLAGFIMFRNKLEKRRRRADRRDSHTEHREAAAAAALGPGEDFSRRGSTDPGEEHVYHSHVRHRRASSERIPYKDKLPDRDTEDNVPYSFFWHRYSPKAAESHVEETRYYSHTSNEDVTEDVCEAEKPGLTNNVGYEEKDKVTEADSSEDITSTSEGFSDEESPQEEETVQFTFDSQSCSAPTPIVSANDDKDNAEETNIQQEEHELENSIAPVLMQEELIKHEKVSSDQKHNPLEDNLPLQCGEPDAMPHLNDVQQADVLGSDNTVSTTFSVEVMKEDLVEATHDETCESEPFKLVDSKDDCSLAATTDVTVVAADLSSNCKQQSEPQMSPTLDAGIYENELCPQELSHFETDADKSSDRKDLGIVNTDSPEATFDNGNVSNVEALSDSLDVHEAERKGVDHQETIKRVETFSFGVKEEDSEASHVEKCESEPFKPVDTKDDHSLAATTDVTVVAADLSSNCKQQSEHLMTPTLDTGIDQNGHCPQELSHVKADADKSIDQKDIGVANTESPEANFGDGKVPDVEAMSDSLDVSEAERKGVDHQETIETLETETSLLSENTEQRQQSQEILPHVRDDKDQIDNLSDQRNKNLEKQQTLSICEENINILDQKEPLSLHVDFKHEECSVNPSAPHEVIEVETSLSGLTSNIREEISTVTDTTVQTNDEKQLKGTPDLDTETTLPPILPSQITGNESEQTCQKDKDMGTSVISATTRDKIESMVEQMVAQVYKDVTQSALEAKPMRLEENKSLELAQNNEDISSGNLVCKEVEREVISNNQTQSVEKTVNSVPCLDNSTTEENNVQKCVLGPSGVSENKDLNASSSGINPPANEAGSKPQKATHIEKETAKDLENLENKISVPSHSVKQMAIEVKSTLMEQNVSLEHLDEVLAQPILDSDNGVDHLADEPVMKVVKQETQAKNVCSNLPTPTQAETTIVSCLEVSDFEKVEDEKAIQSSTEKDILEGVTTSNQCEQKKSTVLLDFDNGLSNMLLGKEEEIPSGIETEVLDITETPNEVQSELKESGMLLDTGNNLSSMTAKSSKVVIVCRTMEASVSTTEMSDDEEVELDGETSPFVSTSKIDSCQNQIDVNGLPVTEEACASLAASSSDTLAAQTIIKEIAPEEKQFTESRKLFDLTSHVAPDIHQDTSASMESTEHIELKDNCASTLSLESGISSMTVSPEEEESRKVTGQETVTTCQVYAEEKNTVSVFTSDGIVTVFKDDSVAMENRPQSSLQTAVHEDLSDELSMTNEDSFGSEIEDDYHKATEELMMQVVDSIKVTSEVTKESVKPDKKKDPACANKENGEKVDSEKTEISIMEATMDHNEWITDGNYQVLPWMTTACMSKDSISSMEAKDIVESKPQAQASTTDESMESAKKVLAVQPMPQNVDVTFRIHYVTLSPYQTVAVTGDQPELGAWKSVVPLVKTKDGYWTCVVSLPSESHVEWKFVVLEKGEVCRWEECGNRLLYTGYGDDLLVHKWWGFL